MGLSEAISLAARRCVRMFKIQSDVVVCWRNIDLSHGVPDVGARRSDCSDRHTCSVCLSGWVGGVKSKWFHLPEGNPSPSCFRHLHMLTFECSERNLNWFKVCWDSNVGNKRWEGNKNPGFKHISVQLLNFQHPTTFSRQLSLECFRHTLANLLKILGLTKTENSFQAARHTWHNPPGKVG